jgi:RsiW-degrading membrane proteinase PrsW (M82 family)
VFCQSCGRPNDESNAFCSGCGKQLKVAGNQPKSRDSDPLAEVLEKRTKQLSGFALELKSMPWSLLLPVRAWLDDRPWNLAWVRWFVFFAFFPLIVNQFVENGITLENTAWAFALYFAAFWILILQYALKPKASSPGKMIFCAVFTAVVGMTVLLTAQQVPGIRNLYAALHSTSSITQGFGYLLAVGPLEEITKVLPLYYLFIYKKEPTTPRDAAFLGCVSGLAFGVSEAVTYSMRYARDLSHGQFDITTYLISQMLRWITLPLLHALWAGVSGYFVGLAASVRKGASALIFAGVAAMALLHGLYDLTNGWYSAGFGILSFLIFILYSRSADLIATNLSVVRTPDTVPISHQIPDCGGSDG